MADSIDERQFLNTYPEEVAGAIVVAQNAVNRLQQTFDKLLAIRDSAYIPAQEKADLIIRINQGKTLIQNMLDGIVNP